VNAEQLAQLALLGEAIDCMGEVAIFVWDEDRHYVAANEAAVELTGVPREELLKMKVGDMTPDRAAPYFEQVQQGHLHRGSLEIHRADGIVEIDWLTGRTKIAGLPYMVSICWRKDAS
jgi:PAS domain S-box-containing protein